MIRVFIFSLSLLLLAQCQSSESEVTTSTEEEPTRPQNIILLIGDGMGVTQVTSRFYYGEGEPNFQRFPYIGLINTSSSREKNYRLRRRGYGFLCGD